MRAERSGRFLQAGATPSTGGPSSYNHFIEPSPDQLLRVSVGLAFKRARLQHVYSILRGKDLETNEFSEERRNDQFHELKVAQAKALNLQHWHDFMQCIRQAGYRTRRMISSQNSLLYAYVFYLIGRVEYRVDEQVLRRAIAQWFFMSLSLADMRVLRKPPWNPISRDSETLRLPSILQIDCSRSAMSRLPPISGRSLSRTILRHPRPAVRRCSPSRLRSSSWTRPSCSRPSRSRNARPRLARQPGLHRETSSVPQEPFGKTWHL